MNTKIRQKTISSFIWRFLERSGAQGVTFIVSIILARLLEPEIYGTIALVTVFTSILQVFVDSGLGNALVQKKNTDDLDFSTVFYFNIFICAVLYVVMFFVSPYIASFYRDPTLTPIIRILSLTLLISGVKNIQQAYVSRKMLFKRFFFATLGGTIGAAVIGIGMAYMGFGVWALVVQQVFNAAVDTIILWITVKWRPKLMFSFQRLKELLSFGWKLLVSSLLDTVYKDIRQLIIGKFYSPADLAYYNRGMQIPNVVVNNINASIDSVLLPIISKYQDERVKVKSMTRRAIRISSYIMWPMMFGIMAIAMPLVRLILTDKWISAVPYLRIFCLIYGLYPIHTANLNAIKAVGRSDLFLKLEIQKKVLGVAVLLISMQYGVMAMACSLLFTSVICSFINAHPNKELLNYSYKEQLRDMLPSFCLAAFMCAMVYCISFIGFGMLLTLAIQIFVGAVIYIGGSVLFKMESFIYIRKMTLQYLHK